MEMLNKATVEEMSANYYDEDKYDTHIFSEEFRDPIRERGYLTKDEFMRIVRWKSARSTGYADRSAETDVMSLTRQAFLDEGSGSAAAILDDLHGVRFRVASALLTVWDPERYTVMDVRAWKSLAGMGLIESVDTKKFDFNRCAVYTQYLSTCRKLAAQIGVPLRTLDRCLWAMNGETPDKVRKRPKTKYKCSCSA
jgi:hypothetical protein